MEYYAALTKNEVSLHIQIRRDLQGEPNKNVRHGTKYKLPFIERKRGTHIYMHTLFL